MKQSETVAHQHRHMHSGGHFCSQSHVLSLTFKADPSDLPSLTKRDVYKALGVKQNTTSALSHARVKHLKSLAYLRHCAPAWSKRNDTDAVSQILTAQVVTSDLNMLSDSVHSQLFLKSRPMPGTLNRFCECSTSSHSALQASYE